METILYKEIQNKMSAKNYPFQSSFQFDDAVYDNMNSSILNSPINDGSTISITSSNITLGSTLSSAIGSGITLGNIKSSGYITAANTIPPWYSSHVAANLPEAKTGALSVHGDADFDGDLRIKGISLSDRLDKIEQRLNILRPNNDLEGRWEKLKELGEQYRAMEAELKEMEKVWDILANK